MEEFYVGQKVTLKDSESKEVFEIVSWNDSTNRGRVEDADGSGWYVFANQIKPVVSPDNENEWEDWDDEEEDEWE